MRIRGSTSILFAAEGDLAAYQFRAFSGETPEVLERLFDQQIAEFAALSVGGVTFELASLDLAGSGDGHSFTVTTIWVDTSAVTTNETAPPTGVGSVRTFFYMGSQAGALARARNALAARIAARLTEAGVDEVREEQTLLAGAQSGTRFMGAVATTTVAVG